MSKLTYLTSNQQKVEEANRHFVKRYGFDIEIVNPDFEILEIQAKNSLDVVKFSVKYAADKLGKAVLKSDTSLYIDYLGGLPGPYSAYFDKQIGADKLLQMLGGAADRKARLEHSFGFCEPGGEPKVFTGGSSGTISINLIGSKGRWFDLFFIPDGETKTLGELRENDEYYEAKFWGTALDDFAIWYKGKYL